MIQAKINVNHHILSARSHILRNIYIPRQSLCYTPSRGKALQQIDRNLHTMRKQTCSTKAIPIDNKNSLPRITARGGQPLPLRPRAQALRRTQEHWNDLELRRTRAAGARGVSARLSVRAC